MNAIDLFTQMAPAATTVAALVLPWTAVLAMHALSVAAGSPLDNNWQLRA
jgi:hypothetical protein